MATNAPGNTGFPSPLTFPLPRGFPLYLHAPCLLPSKPWERNSGNLFPCETARVSTGVWRHGIVPAARRGTVRREANSCPLQKNSHFLTPLSFLEPDSSKQSQSVCGYEVQRHRPEDGRPARAGVGDAEKLNYKRRRLRSLCFVSLVYPDCLWPIGSKQRGEKKIPLCSTDSLPNKCWGDIIFLV